MKIKKKIAALLAIAMVLTSQTFSTPVLADEMASQETVEVQATNEDTTVDLQASTTEDKEEAVVEALADTEETVIAGEETKTADESLEAEAAEDSEEKSEEESSEEALAEEDVELTDDISDTDTSIEGDNKETLEASDEESLDAICDEEILTGDEETEASKDYFTVDTDGTLRKKEGAIFPSSVNIPSNAKKIPADIFKGDRTVTIVALDEDCQVTEIAPNAFRGSAVTSITIPKGVTVIDEGVFQGSDLTEIKFEDETKIAKINKYAFKDCKLLGEIVLSKCTIVDESAFEGCTSLATVTMKNLLTIGESAFAGCSSLGTGFTFYESIERIGDRAFMGCGFKQIDLTKLTNLESKSSSAGEQLANPTLGNGVFESNLQLTKVYIASTYSDKITYIPDNMFSGCTKLDSVSIPTKTLTIGVRAFADCTSLSEIDLKEAMYVKTKAFEGCSKLTKIYLKYKDDTETTHVDIIKDAFPPITGVTMYGYDSYVERYANERGYKFVSLYEKYTVKLTAKDVKAGIVSGYVVDLQEDKRKPGSVVTILVTANSGYVLRSVSYMGEHISDYGNLEYIGENSDNNYIFRFVMPEDNVEIIAEGVKVSEISNTPPEVGFDVNYKENNNNASNIVEPEKTSNGFKWGTRGLRAKLCMKVNKEPYGNWMYKFTSSNPSVVNVDAQGVITGVSNGTAKITYEAKYNSKIKYEFTVTVGGNINIGQVYVGKDNKALARKFINAGMLGEVDIDPVTKYPVVTFNKAVIANTNISFEVDFEAYRWKDDDKTKADYNTSESYMVDAEWKSTDTGIATVVSRSVNNHNEIKIVKGSEGEAQISISTKNTGETVANGYSDKWKEDNIACIIVRVVDITPRVAEDTIVVNYQLKYGTPISVIPVYGYEISDDGEYDKILQIKRKHIVNGIPEYIVDEDLKMFRVKQFNNIKYKDTAHYNDGYWYITTDGETNKAYIPAPKQKIEYSNLYLVGSYADAREQEFAIPLKSFALINEQLAPKVGQTGDVNVFYNYTADEGVAGSVTGKVTVTQSLTNEKVDGYKLVSVANKDIPEGEDFTEPMLFKPVQDWEDGLVEEYGDKMRDEKGNLIPYDSFAYNFDIKADPTSTNNSKAIITKSQCHMDIATVNNKQVFSGYLYIYYTEYKDPVKVPLTVKTKNVAPSYKLSRDSVTAYADEKGQVYPLYLYPSNKANLYSNAVSLKYTYVEDGFGNILPANRYLRIDKSKSTTTKIDTEELYKLTDKQADGVTDFEGLKHDYIRIKVPDDVSTSGKVVISVHMTTWSDPDKVLNYTFTIKQTAALKPVMSVNKITLNKAWIYGNDDQRITLTTSSEDAYISEISKVSYKPSASNLKQKLGYETIANLILNNGITSVVGNQIIVKQPNAATLAEARGIADSIATGSYSFTAVPKAKLKITNKEIDLSPIKFTISVVDKKPTITLGSATLNTNAKSEKVPVSLKMTNLISGNNMVGYKVFDHTDDAEHFVGGKVITDVVYTKTKTDPLKGYTDTNMEYYKKSFDFKVAEIEYDTTGALAYVAEGDDLRNYAGSYTVEGVKLRSPGGCVADVTKYKVNIKANTKEPTVTVKAKGEINMVLPASEIVYTCTLKNVTGKITSVKVLDKDKYGDYEPSHFYAYIDKNDDKVIHLRQRTGWDGTAATGWNSKNEEMVAGKTYELALCLGVDSMNPPADMNYSTASVKANIKVVPVNKFPKLTVKSTRSYAYAGQNRDDNYGVGTSLSNNQWDIVVTAQLDKNYWGQDQLYYEDINKWVTVNKVDIDRIDWAGSLSKSVKDEFTILPSTFTYKQDTGTIEFAVRLKNASEQKQNSMYTLKFAPMYNELQRKLPVEGTGFSIDVTVRK